MQRKVNYKDILKIDPDRFDDLEQTMRMLYDHGELELSRKGAKGGLPSTNEPVPDDKIPTTNASLREP